MSYPRGIVWAYDEGTAVKHELLRGYLDAWLPIMVQKHPRFGYVEGFAGPGVYTGGEPGSPVIVQQLVRRHAPTFGAHPGHRMDLLFIEEDARRCKRLVVELDGLAERESPLPANAVSHPPVSADCALVLESEVTKLSLWGCPLLVVLDSFGGPDVPFTLLQRVAQNRSSEVLVTFGPRFLTRFGESHPEHVEDGNRAFGSAEWQGLFAQPPQNKARFLVATYREAVRRAGFQFVLAFEMVDRGGGQLWQVFGTNHPLGLQKMKDAMWKVDPRHGVRYRDPNDPNQLELDIDDARPDMSVLHARLLDHLQAGPLSVKALKDFTDVETVYRRQHAWKAIQALIRDQRANNRSGGRLSDSSVLDLDGPAQGELF